VLLLDRRHAGTDATTVISRRTPMKKLALALAATAGLSLGAAALTPAMANYSYCSENPAAKGCPGDFNVKDEPFAAPTRHASDHHAIRPSHNAALKSVAPRTAAAKHESTKPMRSAKNEPAKPSKSASHQTKEPAKHG